MINYKRTPIEDLSPDQLYRFICDKFHVSYYDREGVKAMFRKIKERLSKSDYMEYVMKEV